MLYLCLDCKFIPLSGLLCYVFVWIAILYLLLLNNTIPTFVSVIATSDFINFQFRNVIPTSGTGKMDVMALSGTVPRRERGRVVNRELLIEGLDQLIMSSETKQGGNSEALANTAV